MRHVLLVSILTSAFLGSGCAPCCISGARLVDESYAAKPTQIFLSAPLCSDLESGGVSPAPSDKFLLVQDQGKPALYEHRPREEGGGGTVYTNHWTDGAGDDHYFGWNRESSKGWEFIAPKQGNGERLSYYQVKVTTDTEGVFKPTSHPQFRCVLEH